MVWDCKTLRFFICTNSCLGDWRSVPKCSPVYAAESTSNEHKHSPLQSSRHCQLWKGKVVSMCCYEKHFAFKSNQEHTYWSRYVSTPAPPDKQVRFLLKPLLPDPPVAAYPIREESKGGSSQEEGEDGGKPIIYPHCLAGPLERAGHWEKDGCHPTNCPRTNSIGWREADASFSFGLLLLLFAFQ